MDRTLLTDAFEHHLWATDRLLDACLALSAEQLDTTVPGTFGSILDTMRHLVGADVGYLATLSGDRIPRIDETGMDLSRLQEEMARAATGWREILAEDIDPDRDVVRHRDDGSEAHAPVGVRVAQVLHHGTDHRSQICTALTTLGIEPPDIDVWEWAIQAGRFREVPAPA